MNPDVEVALLSVSECEALLRATLRRPGDEPARELLTSTAWKLVRDDKRRRRLRRRASVPGAPGQAASRHPARDERGTSDPEARTARLRARFGDASLGDQPIDPVRAERCEARMRACLELPLEDEDRVRLTRAARLLARDDPKRTRRPRPPRVTIRVIEEAIRSREASRREHQAALWRAHVDKRDRERWSSWVILIVVLVLVALGFATARSGY